MRRLARRRATNKWRSNASGGSSGGGATNTCSTCGKVFEGFQAAGCGIDWYDAPAGDPQSLPFQFRAQVGAGGVSQGGIAVEEHHADPVVRAQFDAGLGGDSAQECLRLAHQQAATVAGFAVGGDRAAMGQAGQGIDGGLDQPVAGPVVHLGDQAKTATVSFEFGPVQPGGIARLLHDSIYSRKKSSGGNRKEFAYCLPLTQTAGANSGFRPAQDKKYFYFKMIEKSQPRSNTTLVDNEYSGRR